MMSPVLDDLLTLCATALEPAQRLREAARAAVWARVAAGNRLDPDALEREQNAAHGLAWQATYVAALEQMLGWARRLEASRRLGDLEALILQAAFAEYLRQLAGGLAMSQSEISTPLDLGVETEAVELLADGAVKRLCREGFTPACRRRIAELLRDGGEPDPGDDDETLGLMRTQFRRFVAEEVAPQAQRWHLNDELVPLEVIESLAELGIFGLTVPERYGGLGLGKLAMCVVTEELSRGSLAVGSLGTRSEIAGELIRLAGTSAQKEKYLPRIASGEILPTAVFTEPNTGSDLASLRTRAVKRDGQWAVTGAKTWITHASRSDLMTLLVRTDPEAPGYKGLSMLLADKARGTEDDPFPVAGLSGSEIKVIGYRGLKEYELSFDGFAVPEDALLGGAEGQGFKQLMATFESARIQTAARAVGVAQSALDLGLAYACERSQFGKALFEFPRVHQKLAWAAVETMVARQLTYFAGREKDADARCDIEAGMAKLLAARVAWASADSLLQVHGGNGYAEEYAISRVLLDSRILNIFEGAAEIQAQVVARGVLGR